MRVPIISGTTADETGAFLTSYPTNREPIVKDVGISDGYLAVPPGIRLVGASGLGPDRGGIAWNGACYRVQGSYLIRINSDWNFDNLGFVGGGGWVRFDYSFDNLIIVSNTALYYWNPSDGLRQVTDVDLGLVYDAIYIDGYTMTTDQQNIVVTELNDPMSVDPLKYGSSEESPDPITGLMHLHGEAYVFNRYTTQVFQNVGGDGFPFAPVRTADAPYGCVGPHAKAKYQDTAAFVGGQENAAPGVYLLGAGTADKISSGEVDRALARLSLAELAEVILETRVDIDEQRLLMHLPEETWCFSAQVSRKSQVKTWHRLVSSKTYYGRYEGRGLVYAYGKWIVGSSGNGYGYLDDTTAQHFGEDIGWQFDTSLLYNESRKAILQSLELVGTPGRAGPDSRIPALPDAGSHVFLSYTKDGETWSVERATPAGKLGQRTQRIAWRPGVRFEQYMGLRFRGVDGALAGFARLEAQIEGLN